MLKSQVSLSRREFGALMGAAGLTYGVGRNIFLPPSRRKPQTPRRSSKANRPS
jgi:hypothetical protein